MLAQTIVTNHSTCHQHLAMSALLVILGVRSGDFGEAAQCSPGLTWPVRFIIRGILKQTKELQ